MSLNISIILSILSIVLTSIIALLSYSAWSFNLTFQYVERKEVQEKKEKIESILFKELRENLNELTKKLDDLSDSEFQATMWRFWKDANLCTFPSKVLKSISWNFSTILKKILYVIVSIILLIISYFLFLGNIPYLPVWIESLSPILGALGVLVIIQNLDFIVMIKHTLILRNFMNDLSEDINLEKMESLEENLKVKKIFK